MNIALCFYGQPRFIDNPLGHSSHKKHIYSQGNVDVYTHYWFSPIHTTFKTSDWASKHNNYIHPDAPKLISDYYLPKKIIQEIPRETFDYTDMEQEVSSFRYYSPNNFKNLQSHLYSFEKVLDLVKDSCVHYDLIIMSRYDNKIVVMPDLKSLPKEKVFINYMCGGNGGFADVIIAFDYSLMTCFKPYSQFREITKQVPMLTAEEYKKHSFLLNKSVSSFCYVNMLARVLRGTNDTDGE